MKGLPLKKGDSGFFFWLSAVNTVLFTVWTVAYIICIFLRNAAFSTAQTNMALTGMAEYTVEITSPFFAVLKTVAFVLPVILTVWTVLLYVNHHRRLALCDNKLFIGSFAADAAAAVFCMLDVTAIHMIF